MTLQDALREHLAASGQSIQRLALQAGLSPKAVAGILNQPGRRPTQKTLDALGEAIGCQLPEPGPRKTYASLIGTLSKKTGQESVDRRNAMLVSRIRKVVRAAGWVPEIEEVDKRRMLERFAGWSPASLGLSPGSFATYKADVLTAIATGCGANRKAGSRDLSGLFREIHEAIQESDLKQDLKLSSGSFLFFLDRCGIMPDEITETVLHDYYWHRVSDSNKTEVNCRKHVKRIAALCTRLSSRPEFSRFRFPAVSHPFADGRDKYDVPESVLAAFLEEFDGPVTRWAMGTESRDGLPYAAFLAQLDSKERTLRADDKKSLLKPRKGGRRKSEEERRSAGFLREDETWSTGTLANRRGLLLAGAKALYAATGFLIESIAEYTDPEVVESVLEAVAAGNSDSEYPSSYASTIGKTLKKLARDYVGRESQDIEAIASLIKDHASGEKGIAKRNRAKLREIVGARQQRLIDVGEILIDEVNAELDRRARRCRGVLRKDLIDAELARDVMCVVASDILLARAPRKENLVGIRLSWISWQDDLAAIRVPNVEVELRNVDDPDLVIPLGPHESRRLRLYLDKIRPKALRPGDATNPFLFPAQGPTVGRDAAFVGLVERLMRHTKRIVGIRMNPHLYRHFVGWVWLREDPNRLPDVQRLLGHKSLETTLQHYAEIDENLALDRWQQFLADQKSMQPKGFTGRKGLK
ncbi:MAG: site-specific integrase [Rhodobacteraceae bacterium]|nr:site-specific integrase [Paracoccaceae bacterium]